jgi:hypothetical protein
VTGSDEDLCGGVSADADFIESAGFADEATHPSDRTVDLDAAVAVAADEGNQCGPVVD